MKAEIIGVKSPAVTDCTDKKCPFHGELTVKKELFRGKVVKKDVSRSATIEWHKPFFVPKYERYEVRRYRLHTHNPGCVAANIGDEVLVAKTRPLSKTKHHVILCVTKVASAADVIAEAAQAVESAKKVTRAAKVAVKIKTEADGKKRK